MRPRLIEGSAFVIGAIVMVLSLVSIATGRTDKTAETSALASSLPSQAPALTAAPGTAAPSRPAAPTKSVPSQAPATTVTGGGPVRPGTAKPPIAGKYVYDETSSNGTRTSSLEITDQGSGKQIENIDDGSQVDEVVWRTNGKYDNATTFQGGPSGSVRCDWNPDFAQYVFPLHAGSSWTVKSSCHPNATTEVDVSGSSHVTGSKRLTVSGESVDTWVVTSDIVVTFKANGVMFAENIHDEDDFSPDHGITVHDVATLSGKDPRTGQNVTEKTTRVLRNLAPGTAA